MENPLSFELKADSALGDAILAVLHEAGTRAEKIEQPGLKDFETVISVVTLGVSIADILQRVYELLAEKKKETGNAGQIRISIRPGRVDLTLDGGVPRIVAKESIQSILKAIRSDGEHTPRFPSPRAP